MSVASTYHRVHPISFFKAFLSQGIRPDGRAFTMPRPLAVTCGSIDTAEGSALVKLGRTVVVVGVKAEAAPPSDEFPDKGSISVEVQLPPICSPENKRNRPSEKTHILAHILSELAKSGHVIPLDALCIREGELAWSLRVDVVCLNDDGNVMDASLIALVAAVGDVRLPVVTFDPESDEPSVQDERSPPISTEKCPISFSFVLLEDHLVADANAEEEAIATSSVSVIVGKDGSLIRLFKPGGSAMSDGHIEQCIKQAQARVCTVVNVVEKSRNSH